MLTKNLDQGVLYIFNDVVKLITKMAIEEINGVELSSYLTKEKLLQAFSKSISNININHENEEVVVNVKVGVVYGTHIPTTIYELQKIIKMHIELFTGFYVKQVNVKVIQVLMEN